VSVAWSGGATNGRMLALATLVAALPVVGLLRFGARPGSLFVALLVGALTLTGALALACVRVTVAPDGLVRVGAGPWGWPARRVAAGEIVHARVERRDPLTLGTLGYHEPPGHTAVMVRGGECLVLDLAGPEGEGRGGGAGAGTIRGLRSFAVALDGAAGAAAAVNARLPAARR
jgi:hypothetical protein